MCRVSCFALVRHEMRNTFQRKTNKMATIIIPTPLRKFTDNKAKIVTSGESVGDSIKQLGALHPDLNKHLFKSDGGLQTFLKIYLGDRDIKALQNENTPVKEEDVISIIPAIAGGKI